MSQRVAIIGGGIGGLAVANLLAKDGFSVTVYDNREQLGGRAGQKHQDGFTFDTGPSWYLMPQVFNDYFAVFGKNADQELDIIRLNPAYKVFYPSRQPITITGDLAKDVTTFESIEAGAGSALERYVKAGDDIYQLALKHFLYTDFSRPSHLLKTEIIRRGLRLSSLLGTSIHRHVASFVKTPALQQILEYPMVFLGTSPFKAPAMYSLMSALDFNEGVFYPKRGMYSIIDAMTAIGASLGVSYRTETEVTHIHDTHGRATELELADGSRISADIIISNADLHHTETKLLAQHAQTYPERYWKQKEAGISALLLYLGVKGELPQLEHHNLYFVDEWHENFKAIYEEGRIPEHASLYVSRTSATDPSTATPGHENLFVLVPLPTGITLNDNEQAALIDRTLDEFSRAADIPDLKQRIVSQSAFGPSDFKHTFHAWKGTALGMSHVLKQSALWRIPPQSKKLSNLYYVGATTMPGIGLPMCLISAELTYKRITGNASPLPLARTVV